ncbi:APC membrane recruitment protein 1 [Camelus dromedarius]|uniref:APC membrane recruitment protein 1 n=1 Tax=Camelus dromedarius TaxID=9838 RepID=A0A5N4C151_CAMDR|nr:APC membrane recruitment protein 1 [Camelus dromedarius]XP_031302420.1 APC membrane recruitment protein 1 [Camelus dromedarius]XP_031302421.1 APC membrane recruitment protein 1 [Camelus dromedarius]KAB1252590.1 APC membrane recruitment protein 1 [Camelus dromedarius]
METRKDKAAQAKGAAVSVDTQDQGAEKGAKNKAAEATEELASETPSSGPGRLKKTALKLFGGKKGICTLPSLFGGGRSKSSGKGSSKKGISKSKTYDGLSEAVDGPEDIVSEGTGIPLPLPESSCRLPSSQSAHGALETGSRHKMSVAGATEKAGAEKAPFVPKPKKGLKGFFSSIRRHRKSKVSIAEQSDPGAKEPEEARARPHEHVDSALLPHTEETLQALRKENAKPQDAPGPKVSSVSEPSTLAPEKTSCKDPENTIEACASALLQPKSAPEASGPEEPHSPETGEKVETGEANPPNAPVGDQLSLLFGDVTSLKSFDSLTGCGDIIAEQDMDSMTDSMASGGQRANRDGTKRSSCLVTYQGGGEEMALPDDDDEEEEEEEEVELEEEEEEVKEEDDELEYLWASTQMYPRSNMNPSYHPTTSPGHHSYMLLDPVRSYPGLAPGDLLTPQSDQQESAPNSDEGYYDSTTPGLEDDSGEALGLIHRDCLPRDSYSGDALYEFFEPDDSLENSPPGDDCLYDLHGHNSEIFDPFLNFEHFSSSRPPGAMETEEERLVTIQKQLLYWELRREQLEAREAREARTWEAHTREARTQETHTREANAREAHTREAHVREARTREAYAREAQAQEVRAQEAQIRGVQARQEKPIMEYQMRPLGPSVMGLVEGASGASQTSHRGTTSAFPATASSEPDWRDFRPLEKRFEGTCSKKDQSTCLMQLFQSDAMFEPDMQEANFGGSPRRAYPTYSPPEEPEEEELENEGNATVSFSQALVEFTSNGNLFSSMSCSSDSDSSFTQNLPELPPMVTFDIADVERDGEGKCEENPEFHNDEDLAASLEAFELGYYQKHAFNNYRSRFYQGLPWGVSSLPRYLGLPGMHPRPPPAAMALNRRSRSLDTAETLELQLSSSHLAQGYMESDELPAQQEDSGEEEEEEEWGRDSPLSLYTEPPGTYDWPAWAPCPLPVGPGPAWISPSQLDGPSSQSPYGQTACCISPIAVSMLLSVSGPESRAPGESRPQLARPSHLPLPMGPCYNLQPKVSQGVRARPRDVPLPVDEPSCSSSPGGFSPSPLPQAKPVGITHGIPQLPRVRPEPPESQPIHYGASSLDLSKERAEQGASLPTSYSSTVMNGNLAE